MSASHDVVKERPPQAICPAGQTNLVVFRVVATIPQMLQLGDESLDSESEMEIDPGSMLDPQTTSPSLQTPAFSIEDMLSTLDSLYYIYINVVS